MDRFDFSTDITYRSISGSLQPVWMWGHQQHQRRPEVSESNLCGHIQILCLPGVYTRAIVPPEGWWFPLRADCCCCRNLMRKYEERQKGDGLISKGESEASPLVSRSWIVSKVSLAIEYHKLFSIAVYHIAPFQPVCYLHYDLNVAETKPISYFAIH